jgi:hypothetical protein
MRAIIDFHDAKNPRKVGASHDRATAGHKGPGTPGIREIARNLWPGLEIAAVVEAHDEEAEAYDKCCRLLSEIPRVAGV